MAREFEDVPAGSPIQDEWDGRVASIPGPRRSFLESARRGGILLNLGAVIAAIVGLSTIVLSNLPLDTSRQIVNVSYDPTRELYQALNPLFVEDYARRTGRRVTIIQSHGGSTRQARKVISGDQPADVVTLGLATDIDALQKRGLVAANWAERLPNRSRPYTSTIVFVVRHGNPHRIKDWPDLVAPHVEIVVPDPRTSGNGKLAALSAWAAAMTRGGSEADARAFLTALYQHVPVLDEAARAAAITFAVQETGDVHLTWENEAIREVEASQGKLQIVYPPVSLLAEPYVAWVDAALDNPEKKAAAKAYLEFLFTDVAQQTVARRGYRPYRADAAVKAGVHFPDLKLIPITAIAKDWNDAGQKFFAENGIVDTVLGSRKKWASR